MKIKLYNNAFSGAKLENGEQLKNGNIICGFTVFQ